MTLGATNNQKFVVVAGTRPEAVKLAPIILALRERGCIAHILASGQHRELFHEALASFGLVADEDLGIMLPVQSPADVVGALVPALTRRFDILLPDAIIVQGDTATAFAGAQAGFYARIPVMHVEAGLRSGQSEPFPEEMHRKAIAQMSSLHFAPTASARSALIAEAIDPAAIHVTGNTGIDALHLVETRLLVDHGLAARIAHRFAAVDLRRPLVLATVHRRENHGARLDGILAALAILARHAEIVLPVHPHPAISGPAQAVLAGRAGVHLLPPLDHPAFVWLLQRAALVLTDSGGVQEEAPALGVPALVLRDVTERREGIATGNARLVGTDPAAIVAAVEELLADSRAIGRMGEASLPYGAGDAAIRIVDVLAGRATIPRARPAPSAEA